MSSNNSGKQGSSLPAGGGVYPWRVPPMGSAGDAWDEIVVLPEEQMGRDAARQKELDLERSRRKPKRKRADEIIFLEHIPNLHKGVIASCVMVGLALASVGPIYPLMPFMALAGFVAGICSVVLLKTIHTRATGMELGVASSVLALGLIITDGVAPRFESYRILTQSNLSAPNRGLGEEGKLERAAQDMKLFADALYCAHLLLGPDVVAVGRDSVNKRIDPESVSFRISTLALKPDREFTPLELESLYVWEANLPPDPFSDDSRATYGVAIIPGAILIYSPGPDGVWQINPRRPLERELNVSELEDYFAPFRYSPLTGAGDLILIRPHEAGGFVENYSTCSSTQAAWRTAWFNK